MTRAHPEPIVADALFSLSLHALPQPPPESWHQHTLPLFFNSLMPRLQRNMVFGLLGFLPDMVAASRPDSPVGLAVQAISCAFSTTRTSDPEARTRRAITYGKALTSTNAALRDQSLQTRDDTVTSVWLLSLYEVNAPFPTPAAGLVACVGLFVWPNESSMLTVYIPSLLSDRLHLRSMLDQLLGICTRRVWRRCCNSGVPQGLTRSWDVTSSGCCSIPW
jgi:hypothetical protein